MDIKQFAALGGCIVVECGAGWGGRYGYTTIDRPTVRVCGFKTKRQAIEQWFSDIFGATAGAAILELLDKE